MNATLTALESVDLTAVPVLSTDRHMPRKDRAAATRKLFKQLGVKGLSVTTPNYSMAHTVDVRLPSVPHYHPEGFEHACPVCSDRASALAKVKAVLGRAFPNHDNRSEPGTDYYDFCWGVD